MRLESGMRGLVTLLGDRGVPDDYEELTMSDRPTPESDAAKHVKYIDLGHCSGYPEYKYVLFDFAQRLERERDTAREEAARLELCARANREECTALKIELETVRSQAAASNEAVLNAAAADRIAREAVIVKLRNIADDLKMMIAINMSAKANPALKSYL